MIVADGLMAFLAPQEMISLLDRLISRFPSGEVVFNGYTRIRYLGGETLPTGTQSIASLHQIPGFDHPREPERWNPRLKLVREILLTREPEVARLSAASPAVYPSGRTQHRHIPAGNHRLVVTACSPRGSLTRPETEI